MPKLLDEILDRLRADGERLTIQRRAVIAALAANPDHQTIQAAQQWIARTQGLHLTETTIYRILEWLKKVGIASQTDMGALGIVYSLLHTPRHHHLICLRCGAIFTLDDSYLAGVREALQRDFHFAARIDHMAIYGQCARCATLERASQS